MKTKWLDRRVAAPGPYLCLVLSQAECDAPMKVCKVQPTSFLSTPRAHADRDAIKRSMSEARHKAVRCPIFMGAG